MMRVLYENNVETEHPLALVNWTNEEVRAVMQVRAPWSWPWLTRLTLQGARFPRSLCGSAVWAGTAQLDDFHALRDVKRPDVTLKAELLRGGYLGDVTCSHQANPLAAHFELHIEQGPILERAGKRIGVVLGGQAYSWFTLTVRGQANHSGTTPLDARADAMLATARIIDRAHQLARKHSGLASTGIISAEPGSINTLPSSVVFTLDVRHASGEKLSRLIADIRSAAADLTSEPSTQGCAIEWRTEFESPEIRFNAACIDAVREAAVRTVGADAAMDVYSGAGHDS
jgi:hydantoinase/carbamoylase family amidase